MSIFLARKNFDGKDHLASTEEGQEVSVVREVAITLPPTFVNKNIFKAIETEYCKD